LKSIAGGFRANLEVLLASGSGPADGNPFTLFSYQPELSSILAILYILYNYVSLSISQKDRLLAYATIKVP
jgi:hypothetical protein